MIKLGCWFCLVDLGCDLCETRPLKVLMSRATSLKVKSCGSRILPSVAPLSSGKTNISAVFESLEE